MTYSKLDLETVSSYCACGRIGIAEVWYHCFLVRAVEAVLSSLIHAVPFAPSGESYSAFIIIIFKTGLFCVALAILDLSL